jgi:glutamate-1-semialdehyde 2,1-aminomutase
VPGTTLPGLPDLLAREEAEFLRQHPRSRELHEQARRSFVYGVPLHWMIQWPSPHPIFLASAQGAHLTDADGHDYVDFCLGDTGAMLGHGNPVLVEAIAEQAARGTTAMLPTEDAVAVGDELRRRFGLPYWEVAVSATDANRFALRMARLATARDKVLVFNGKYHGSIDETQVALVDGRMVPQPGVSPNGVDFDRVTKIVEFNDVAALERALAARDVACVITEPVMTNVGMVPPQPGYHEALREITRRTGTLLLIDETHTISTGPSGYTGAHGLEPDIFVLGKSIAGGIPVAVYGMSGEVAAALRSYTTRPGRGVGHFGFGGTLAANALTMHVLRVALERVMTDDAFARMTALAGRFAADVRAVLAEYRLPWHVTQIGARAEYMFSPTPPRTGGEAKSIRNPDLEAAIHLFLLNRGVLLTPFHSMALMSPLTTEGDVARHSAAFAECIAALTGVC